MPRRFGHGAFGPLRRRGTAAASTPPTLGTVTLDSTSWTNGTSAGGSILGSTNGSTLSISGQPTGFTIISANRTWAFDGTGAAGSGSFTLTETLTGATGTPKANTINYTIAASGGGATFKFLQADGTSAFLLADGTSVLLEA